MLQVSTSFMRMMGSFAEQNKIAELIYHGHGRLRYDEVNYLTMRGSLISYLPAGRPHLVNDDGRWSREGRQEGKPGRVIRKILNDQTIEDFDIDDRVVEHFSNLCVSYVMANGDDESTANAVNLHVVNGMFINYYYDGNYHSPLASGNLSNSCMAFKDIDYFDIYSSNPDACHMIVALDGERKLAGRALLWKTDDAGYCMDTIYAAESMRPLFIEFAIKNNIRYKSHQSCHHQSFDMLNGQNVNDRHVSVTLQSSSFNNYPYVDTLYYLKDDKLSNYEPDNDDGCGYHSLRCTGGGSEYIESDNTVYDDWDDTDIDEDDSVWLDYVRPNGRSWHGNTHIDNTVHCYYNGFRILEEDAVHVRGQWYLSGCDAISYDDFNHEWIKAENSVYCDGTGKTASEEDVVLLYNGEYEHRNYVHELVDGRFAYENDGDIVELHDGRYAHINDAVLLYNGEYAHTDEQLVILANGDVALRDGCTEVFIPNELVDDITNNLLN